MRAILLPLSLARLTVVAAVQQPTPPNAVGGTELTTTVLPFILRGIKLLGIDSVMCPMPTRLDVWRRLTTDLKPAKLVEAAHQITLEALPSAVDGLLKAQARGRYVVKLS